MTLVHNQILLAAAIAVQILKASLLSEQLDDVVDLLHDDLRLVAIILLAKTVLTQDPMLQMKGRLLDRLDDCAPQ